MSRADHEMRRIGGMRGDRVVAQIVGESSRVSLVASARARLVMSKGLARRLAVDHETREALIIPTSTECLCRGAPCRQAACTQRNSDSDLQCCAPTHTKV